MLYEVITIKAVRDVPRKPKQLTKLARLLLEEKRKDSISKSKRSVITSYSIHYTKLYDYAFDTPAEIEAMRERLKAAKVANPQYNATSREWMRNA